jgi:hypothetical protein
VLPFTIGETVTPVQSILPVSKYALDRFAIVSSIFRSSAHVEIWYGLADDPSPPANAEAFCAGLTETATEMAVSRKREQMHNSFLIEKFYTKCRIFLDVYFGAD